MKPFRIFLLTSALLHFTLTHKFSTITSCDYHYYALTNSPNLHDNKSSIELYVWSSNWLCFVPANSRYASVTPTLPELLTCGDIEVNPGPTPCATCDKTVRKNQKQIQCAACLYVHHLTCIFKTQKINPSASFANWTCINCAFVDLPFNTCKFDNSTDSLDISDSDTSYDEVSHHLKNHQRQLKILHLNMRSLTSKFSNFQLFFNEYRSDIFAMSETWLRHQQDLLEYVTIPGYDTEFKSRSVKRGGGVGAYIRSGLEYKRRKDIERQSDLLEHLWLDLKGVLVGIMYRPPNSSTAEWFEHFENVLQFASQIPNKQIIITGDFNIDLLKNADSCVFTYTNLLASYGLQQHVQQPTHVTSNSSTLIDHVICTEGTPITFCKTIDASEISDHSCVATCFNFKVKVKPVYKIIRDEKTFVPEHYLADVSKCDFSSIYNLPSVCEKAEMFSRIFTSLLNMHVPLKRIRATKPPAPWLSDDAVNEAYINCKKCKSKFKKNKKDESFRKNFRNATHILAKAIRRAKRSFFDGFSTNNTKDLWKSVNRILKPNISIKLPPSCTIDSINTYFVNTAARLTGKQPNLLDYLTTKTNDLQNVADLQEFGFIHVTMLDVKNVIDSLKSNASTGPDNIPIKYIKLAEPFITPIICHIVNCSLTTSTFPSIWKLARISPIPKVDLPTSQNDFRPIAVLPALSKILEKVVLNQVLTFIDKTDIYSSSIHGFRRNHSTVTALLSVKDTIVRAMAQGEIAILTLVDFSRAFDTIDFDVLIDRLHVLGFHRTAIRWFLSFVTNRKQFVQIDENQSATLSLNFGVPQGSILGPVLFNLIVSDFQSHLSKDVGIEQYADDTQLIRTCKPENITDTITKCSEDLSIIRKLSKDRNLVFNCKKTNFLIVGSKRFLAKPEVSEINSFICESDSINRIYSVKNLGVTFDPNLTWCNHFPKVFSSCYHQIRILKKIYKLCNYRTRKYLAETLILPKIDYCSILFTNVPKYVDNRVNRLLATTASFVFNRYCTKIDVSSIGWLDSANRRNFNILLLVHKILYKPLSFITLDIHSPSVYNLRDNVIKLSTGPIHSFQYIAASLFNKLDPDIRITTVYTNFKNIVFNVMHK